MLCLDISHVVYACTLLFISGQLGMLTSAVSFTSYDFYIFDFVPSRPNYQRLNIKSVLLVKTLNLAKCPYL